MKKAILITSLLIVSFASYSQIKVISTDSLKQGNKSVYFPYKFFYNKKFIMSGKKEEDTKNLKDFSIKKIVTDTSTNCKYEVIQTYVGDIYSISQDCNKVRLISSEGKIFIFH